jgi:mediator of RNA polymerase II transcription subunit 31
LDDQAILQWQQYTRKRMRLIENPNSGNTQQQNAEVSIKQEESTEA